MGSNYNVHMFSRDVIRYKFAWFSLPLLSPLFKHCTIVSFRNRPVCVKCEIGLYVSSESRPIFVNCKQAYACRVSIGLYVLSIRRHVFACMCVWEIDQQYYRLSYIQIIEWKDTQHQHTSGNAYVSGFWLKNVWALKHPCVCVRVWVSVPVCDSMCGFVCMTHVQANMFSGPGDQVYHKSSCPV